MEKQIDIMAKDIDFLAMGIEHIRKRIEEKYCEYVKGNDDYCNYDTPCINCIKEYYEKKSKEEGELYA